MSLQTKDERDEEQCVMRLLRAYRHEILNSSLYTSLDPIPRLRRPGLKAIIGFAVLYSLQDDETIFVEDEEDETFLLLLDSGPGPE